MPSQVPPRCVKTTWAAWSGRLSLTSTDKSKDASTQRIRPVDRVEPATRPQAFTDRIRPTAHRVDLSPTTHSWVTLWWRRATGRESVSTQVSDVHITRPGGATNGSAGGIAPGSIRRVASIPEAGEACGVHSNGRIRSGLSSVFYPARTLVRPAYPARNAES
ncbi:hypothetical protein [Amycolatopsis regifaucium]|uniref:hypothetical protein n=1 Tax=Amycolatopsis regifaucium TaxID=546365 RepID=UPI001160664B|nr:hypothetical protein [Amycolatopsis regifaucium]